MAIQDEEPVTNAPVQMPLGLQLPQALRFENFVAGPNAAVVEAVARLALAEDALACLWGPDGSGRTHLACALAAAAHAQGAGGVAYVPIGRSMAPAVFDGIERCRVAVVDDVHLAAGNDALEAALNHAHNRLRAARRTLLYTLDSPPAASAVQLADLRSRLGAGEVWQLTPLGDEALMAAFRRRALDRGIVLEAADAEYVLRRAPRHMGALTRCLDELERLSLAERRRLTQRLLRDAVEASLRDQ